MQVCGAGSSVEKIVETNRRLGSCETPAPGLKIKDALILDINGACGGIEITDIAIKKDIATFKMQDTKTKTAKSFVIRDEVMNKFKNNPKNIVLATNTIQTAKSHEDVHHASSASHQQHQLLYTDPCSRDPPDNIEHCSPDKIKIDTQPKFSITLPFAHYLYYIIIIMSLSTTIVHCSQIGDRPQSALNGSNSQLLLPSQRERRANKQSTSDTTFSQPGSVSNIQQTNIRGPGGPVKVKIINCPNMRDVTFDDNGEPGGITAVTLTNCANMLNVHFIFNAGPGRIITVTITNAPYMSNVKFILYAAHDQPVRGSQIGGSNSQPLLPSQQEGRASEQSTSDTESSLSNIQHTNNIDGPGGPVKLTLLNCPTMRDVIFKYNGEPGGIITVSPTNCANMSKVKFIFNSGPDRTIIFKITNCPNMSNVTFIFNAAPGRIISITITNRPNMSNVTYTYN